MTTSATDALGECSAETVLHFEQLGNVVSARYRGGQVIDGYLIGVLNLNKIAFRYVQIGAKLEVDGGHSEGEFEVLTDGRLQLTEHFHWDTRCGSGTNVFIQVGDTG